MAATLQTPFSNAFSWEKFVCFDSTFHKFVPEDPIDNKSALVQEMAWHKTGNKPLPKPKTTHFTNAFMRNKGPLLLTWFNPT